MSALSDTMDTATKSLNITFNIMAKMFHIESKVRPAFAVKFNVDDRHQHMSALAGLKGHG